MLITYYWKKWCIIRNKASHLCIIRKVTVQELNLEGLLWLGPSIYFFLFWFVLPPIFLVNVYVSVSYPLILLLCNKVKIKIHILCLSFWPISFLFLIFTKLYITCKWVPWKMWHNGSSQLAKSQTKIWFFPNSELQETYFMDFTHLSCYYYDKLF